MHSTNMMNIKRINFVESIFSKVITIFLFIYGIFHLIVPIIFGLIEIPFYLGHSPITDAIFYFQWAFVMLSIFVGGYPDVFWVLALAILLYFTLRSHKANRPYKFYLYPLIFLLVFWIGVSPIGITYHVRWRGSNKIAGQYLLNSAGGEEKVKADALAYLNGESEKDYIEFNIIDHDEYRYTKTGRFRIESNYITIHLGAFFNMGVQFGFIVYAEDPVFLTEPIDRSKYHEPLWYYGDGIYMYGY